MAVMRASTLVAVGIGIVLAGSQGRAAAQARRIVVAEPVTIGIDAATATTFADLLRAELARRPEFQVVARSATPQEPCGEPACATALAHETGAHSTVTLNLSALGSKVIVRVQHVEGDGRILYADRITAASAEDLDVLSQRVGVALATGKPLGETATTNTVTAQEGKTPTRRQSLLTGGMRLGPAFPVGDSYGGSGTMFDLNGFAMFEIDHIAVLVEADLRFTADTDASEKAMGLGIDLGARYFPDLEDTGWFVGGGLGFRLVAADRGGGVLMSESDSRSGFGGHLAAGVMFLRTYDLHLIIEARYDIAFFELDELSAGQGTQLFMLTAGFAYTGWWKTRWGL